MIRIFSLSCGSKEKGMAQLAGLPAFTGSMAGLSAYKMRGVEGIVLRAKGGPGKQQIKNSPAYEIIRRRNAEWAGCMQLVKQVNRAIHPVRHLYGSNYTGRLAAVCKSILEEDTTGVLGKRSVQVSKAGYKLEGFTLNQYHPFDTVLRHPLAFSVNRQNGTAIVNLPELVPGLNLTNPLQQPLYRLVFVLGLVADMVFDEARKEYMPQGDDWGRHITGNTPWYTAGESSAAQTIDLSLPNYNEGETLSLILAAGVEYGRPVAGGHIKYTKYAGSAKLLKVG